MLGYRRGFSCHLGQEDVNYAADIAEETNDDENSGRNEGDRHAEKILVFMKMKRMILMMIM